MQGTAPGRRGRDGAVPVAAAPLLDLPFAMSVRVRVNGERRDVEPGTSVDALIRALGLDPRFVIAERNGEPVERARYDEVPLQDGDRVELVRAVAGG